MKNTIAMLCSCALAGALITSPANAQEVDFGDDSSTWSNDIECDDPRFEGDGMASTLLDEDAFSDATDCRALYNKGSIRLRSSYVDFGDNSSSWSFDDECDDPRFEGNGMATTLLEEDRLRDAADCRALYDRGDIRLRVMQTSAVFSGTIDFGNDTSEWANDNECDDPRFENAVPDGGMAGILLDDDLRRDASDCRALYEAGRIRLK